MKKDSKYLLVWTIIRIFVYQTLLPPNTYAYA